MSKPTVSREWVRDYAEFIDRQRAQYPEGSPGWNENIKLAAILRSFLAMHEARGGRDLADAVIFAERELLPMLESTHAMAGHRHVTALVRFARAALDGSPLEGE